MKNEELEIAKRKIKVFEDQIAGNDNEIISQQKELVADLSKRVKLLQEEINLVTQKHHAQLVKAKKIGSSPSNRSMVSRIPSNNNKWNNSRLNMTVDDEVSIPSLGENSTGLKNRGRNKIMKSSKILNSKKNKLFSLKTDEDRQILNHIDKLDSEDLRIQLLDHIKTNIKLEDNLEAVKQEMNSKINLLRQESQNEKTMKYNEVNRPDSSFSRKSRENGGGNNLYYENKLNQANQDNKEAYQRISVLQTELQNQENFFKNKLKNQFDKGIKMQEESIMSEGKFVGLIDKLTHEQSQIYADKKRHQVNIKDTVDAAKLKVTIV